LLGSLGVLLLAAAQALGAPTPDHAIVPGFERLLAAGKGDPVHGGQLLLGELNCIGCHQPPAGTPAVRNQGPVLDHVATRVHFDWLRRLLRDPQGVKPGTTMPAVFAADPAREEKVEALVHFLAATGTLRQERPRPQLVRAGGELYHKVGCVACHGSRDAAGAPDKVLSGSVPLGDLKAKYALGSLAAFLEVPHQVRPSGRMPRLLDGKEARAVANYLLQGIHVDLPEGPGTTRYAYYEGSWDRLPDFDRLKPLATGVTAGFDLGTAPRDSHFGLKFEGFLRVDREDGYAFTLGSDDGSRLYVDGRTVVDVDGLHEYQEGAGAVRLTKGVHKITVLYFQRGAEMDLQVRVEAPGLGRRDLGELVAASAEPLNRKPAPPKVPNADTVEINPALVRRGQALFTSEGCAACHELHAGGQVITAARAGPPLERLNGAGGCLADGPVAGVPRYSLSAAQRQALAAALHASPGPERTPAAVVTRTLAAFNCQACHVRDNVGGPGEELDRFFRTAQPEMGDEGRVPPPLDGVGAKLNADYLRHLLDQGGKDRPYMLTRMPAFGAANVGGLVEALAVVDRLPAVPAVRFAEKPAKVKAIARHLVGGFAFGCIKCHTFAGHQAEGVQGIDMTLMPRRLRRDWFHAYVADPQRVRPGTRMPAAFDKGKSVLPAVLDGTARAQIEAIWRYLQDGPAAALPPGLQKRSIVLVPTGGAILYRNFIEGAGPRGIGVGYPEKVNLAFDAGEMRLALLWEGAFLDAARHWTDRGAGFEPPAGDNVLHLSPGPTFAVLARPDEPWPTAPARELGWRFTGYRLTHDDRPTFLYGHRDVSVEDFPNPVAGKEGFLRRTLTLKATKPVDKLYFRAAAAGKIEPLPGVWYRIDGTWKIRLEGGQAQVRSRGGQAELLVGVRFDGGRARLVQEFAW
jgi:mono/diheme cytochrome c family protein